MASCVASTRAECNLPAFIRAILRIVFRAILGRGGGPWREKKSDIILTLTSSHPVRSTPTATFRQGKLLATEQIRLSFRASRGSKIIVVAVEQWRGRSSAGEIHAGIRRRPLFEMGKACFSRRPREQGRKLVQRRLAAAFSTTRSERAARQSRRWQSGLPLDKCPTPYGVATEGHLSGFLNYLVRKFLLAAEFRSESKGVSLETFFGYETSDATRS